MKKLVLLLITLCLLAGCGSKLPDYSSMLGTVTRDTLLGVPCQVYLPYAYSARTKSGKEVFPVLYLQHGMYGSEDDWITQGDLLRLMDTMLQSKAVREMVVVMPDNFLGSMPPAERQALMAAPDLTPDNKPFDTSNGSAHWRKLTDEQEKNYEMSGYWETHFAEFMAEAESRYCISRDPSCRAIAGLSMGGFHTMHVSHHLHGQFGYIGLFSALVASPEDIPVYSNWQDEVRAALADASLYWIGIGRDDFLYNQLQDYLRWLDENNLKYTYYESAGGHTWKNWQDYIVRFMTPLFKAEQ